MDQPASTFSPIPPPPQSSPSQPKASFSSPSFIRPPPNLNSTFYPTPRATPRIKKEEEEEGRPLDPDDDYLNNWGEEWTDMGYDIDADKDLDEDEFSAWDSEKVAASGSTKEKACLERSAKDAPSKVFKSVPVNENSLGIARRTLGAGRPKRKALLCSIFVEGDGETSAVGAGGVVGRGGAASSVGSHSLGTGSTTRGPATGPITRTQSQRTIFRLGTSTSFKKVRRVPPELKMTELHPTLNSENRADPEALGKDDENSTAAPDTDTSTSKGEGSSTDQIKNESAEAKVKIKTEALDETAVKGELSSKVENDDAKASKMNPASTSDVKDGKVKDQVA